MNNTVVSQDMTYAMTSQGLWLEVTYPEQLFSHRCDLDDV